MRAPKEVEDLVKNFKTNIKAHKSGKYNEEQLRTDYLNPFFIALGWDVSNQAGKIEAYRDVLMEAGVNKKNSGRSGRVDYAFKLQKTTKFFVEAKKPKVDIYGEKSPAFQIREYGWWGRVSIGVLTDFEEFAVYNTHYRPKETDKPDKRRLKYFRYDQYLENWSFFQDTFSRQAVADGSLEKLADTDKDKEKIITVDALFLDEIEKWRKKLASDIAKRNKNPAGHSILNLYDLNLAVQTIIDRIIFLKFAEARGMEAPQEFRGLEKSSQLYASLDKLFLQADKKYNSGLFKRNEDREFISKLQVGDGPLRIILAFLEKSSYGFKTLPVEILGSIYERFLGKTIYFTKEKAKVEEKPETRKAGGVYYTPQYIVDYIVENTVGEKLKDQKWNGVQTKQTLTILDPACGSGSFLVNAYEKLLNWHLEYYSQAGNTALALKEGKIYEVKSMSEEKKQTSKTYRLSIVEKQRILLNSIYGVDLDRQAVEVSKLSLLLKLMEDENVESEEELFKHSDLQMLPDLSGNIKCGNSLIGRDFYKGEESLFPIEERQKVNVFDWEGDDGFPEIMKAGGFDCVIGNPPWIDIKGLENHFVRYLFKRYNTVENRMNVYAIFLQKGLSLLSKMGLFGFITPSSYFTQSSYTKLREFVLHNYSYEKVLRLPDNVFENVVAESAISILRGEKKSKVTFEATIYEPKSKISEIKKSKSQICHSIDQNQQIKSKNYVINLFLTTEVSKLLDKIEDRSSTLISICDFSLGLTPYDKYKGHTSMQIKNRVFHSSKRENELFKPLISGGNINRYITSSKVEEYIKYGEWLGAPREQRFFTDERIIVRQIVSGKPLRIYAGYTTEELYNSQIGFNLLLKDNSPVKLKFVLAILNSNLLNFYHTNRYLDQSKNVFQKILIENAKNFPIRIANRKGLENQIIKLVDRMLFVQKKLHNTTSPSEKTIYQKDVDRLDRDIDNLVYELYELTPEEIRIVEGEG